MKSSIPFALGFLGPSAIGKKIGPMKYLDWNKAKKIIFERIDENPNCCISAGLREDWQCTSGVVYDSDGWYCPYTFYGCSVWATPIIDIDGEEIECWTHKKTEEESALPAWIEEKCKLE